MRMKPKPMVEPATARQMEVLDVIREHIAAHGCPPTVREIARAIKVKSNNGVVDFLVALERKGLITRIVGSSRSIRIVEDVVRQRVEVDGVAYDVEIRRAP